MIESSKARAMGFPGYDLLHPAQDRQIDAFSMIGAAVTFGVLCWFVVEQGYEYAHGSQAPEATVDGNHSEAQQFR